MKSSYCSLWKFYQLIACLTLFSLLIVGCGGGGGGGDSEELLEYGFIEGGQVEIHDQYGQSILTTPTRTDQDGAFQAFILGLPSELYIEVSGGQVNKIDDNGNAYSEPFVHVVGRYVDDFQSGRYVEMLRQRAMSCA